MNLMFQQTNLIFFFDIMGDNYVSFFKIKRNVRVTFLHNAFLRCIVERSDLTMYNGSNSCHDNINEIRLLNSQNCIQHLTMD